MASGQDLDGREGLDWKWVVSSPWWGDRWATISEFLPGLVDKEIDDL